MIQWWDEFSVEEIEMCCILIETPSPESTKNETSVPLSNEISMEKTKETLIEAVKLAKKIQPELNYNNPSKDALSFTRKIIILYNTQPNLSSFYSVYSTECIFAAKYFGLEQSYAALLMIKVFDVIAKSGKEKGVSSQVQDEVTEKEKGIVEYIAGYTLKKAKRKLSSLHSEIAKLCTNRPAYDFGSSIEKLEGHLLFPVLELLHVFQQVYAMYVAEITKHPKDIDFLTFLNVIKTSTFYAMGLDQLLDQYGIEENEAAKIFDFLFSLYIKVLSHRYAKFVLNKNQKRPTKETSSFRSELQSLAKS